MDGRFPAGGALGGRGIAGRGGGGCGGDGCPAAAVPGRDATGAFSVTIADLAGPNYTLEASRDLQTWYVATNGIATSGLMRVTDPNGVPPRRIYYRARDGQPSFLRVEPQVDTNAMVVALLTPRLAGNAGSRIAMAWCFISPWPRTR